MTTSTPISRAKAVASLFPIVAIVLIGIYSHKHFGTDGIAGVLLGVYLILYTVFAVNRWKPETLSPFRSLVHRFRAVLIIAGVAGIIGGSLDMLGRF